VQRLFKLMDKPERLTRICDALKAGDREKLSRQAHDLKSNAANVGLGDLSVLASRLEHQAWEAAPEQLNAWVDELSKVLPESTGVLKRWVEMQKAEEG
jgi:HPt (histidine-containing phosphotransfer) domain-containing protein